MVILLLPHLINETLKEMKPHYRVKLTPHPIIIRVQDDKEEIIFDRKHLKISQAERIVAELNQGVIINFDNLN